MRRIIKKQKKKPTVIVEPPPHDESVENSDNRIYQRRRIINELDLIKDRVHQVAMQVGCSYYKLYILHMQIIQNFETEVQSEKVSHCMHEWITFG